MSENESYNLSDIPSDFAGDTKELSEPQKAQIKMTYWVLSGAAILLLLSGGMYVFTENGLSTFADDIRNLCSNGNIDATKDFCNKYSSEIFSIANGSAKEFFEFCKNFIPPIVTLVLGAHYVTRSTEQNT